MRKYPVGAIRSLEREWRRCIHTFLRERTIASIARATRIPISRVAKMAHHLRVCMARDFPKRFVGPVELDETYVGGQRKNQKLHIRKIKGKRGHGTEKLPIVGLLDRFSGCAFVEVGPKLSMEHILDMLATRVEAGGTVYSDGFKMYRMLPKHGYTHEYVNHNEDEYIRGDIHTNNVEGFWGILKRKLGCIGGVRRDRLPLFVGEIVWRFNNRNKTLKAQEEKLLRLVKKYK